MRKAPTRPLPPYRGPKSHQTAPSIETKVKSKNKRVLHPNPFHPNPKNDPSPTSPHPIFSSSPFRPCIPVSRLSTHPSIHPHRFKTKHNPPVFPADAHSRTDAKDQSSLIHPIFPRHQFPQNREKERTRTTSKASFRMDSCPFQSYCHATKRGLMPPNCLPRQWEGMMMRETTSNSTFMMPALMLQQTDRIAKQNRTETTTTGSTPET